MGAGSLLSHFLRRGVGVALFGGTGNAVRTKGLPVALEQGVK